LLAAAQACGATDVHLQPTAEGLELKVRADSILRPIGTFPAGIAANVVTRLKVLAGLLTYRNDTPQEGRLRIGPGDLEVRVCTFPTLYGERAVVRIFASTLTFRTLDDLHLSGEIAANLRRLLHETSGAILVTGPAGSGKTTTLYACLSELAAQPTPRSLITLEDPIEIAVPGVAQSQVNTQTGFDLAAGLRGVLRQDPEVIMVGEIRDATTAGVAMQASLTGQLVLSSFHAGSAVEAIGRLLDMGIEPYIVRSGILAVISQRLVRKLCSCARKAHSADDLLGLNVRDAKVAVGCERCGGTGYRGRAVLAEMLTLDDPTLASAVLARADAHTLTHLALSAGLIDQWARAHTAIESGLTSASEIRRVLGFCKNSAD
jgi:type II secretory ATPase GspE/PulE/Tfp pilus assembly ATPase PilB-like protein